MEGDVPRVGGVGDQRHLLLGVVARRHVDPGHRVPAVVCHLHPDDAERVGQRRVRLREVAEPVRGPDAELGLDVAEEVLRVRQRECDRKEDAPVVLGQRPDPVADLLVVPLDGQPLEVVEQRPRPALASQELLDDRPRHLAAVHAVHTTSSSPETKPFAEQLRIQVTARRGT